MIKLLILSDSHGDTGTMLDVVEREKPDEIIHLGDCFSDAESLSYAYPDVPVCMVPGNCDFSLRAPDKLTLERMGHTILLAHGHQWRVKSGPALALEAGWEAAADCVLYGHTHVAECWQEQGMWVINPGSVGGRHAPATYGLLFLTEDGMEGRIMPV